MRARVTLMVFLALILPQTAKAETPQTFKNIPGWDKDDFAKAWKVFYDSCAGIQKGKATTGNVKEYESGLKAVCTEAAKLPRKLSNKEARHFFETHFEPVKLEPIEGNKMTGYNEPNFEASTKKTDEFSVPVLRRPADLVSEKIPGSSEPKIGRRLSDGTLVPYPDRTEIETDIEKGKLNRLYLEAHVDGKKHELWMRRSDLFYMQVQGSGRLRLDNGKVVRLAYDGKNGQPYSSIGRVLLRAYDSQDGPYASLGKILRERNLVKEGKITMQAIGEVFKIAAASKDENIKKLPSEVMRENKSYIFFRVLPDHDPKLGPIGAQGLALTPYRSIAVDSTRYTYGLPFFIDGTLLHKNEKKTFRQLAIAQDTGTAIKGIGRVDLFAGSDEKATDIAGRLNDEQVDIYLLRPKQ
jgi:membrane-bound lytic murein transglycosylase A